MKLLFIAPRLELRPYVSKLWIFESAAGLVGQGSLIAPNARAKIIIPYKNALTTTDHKATAVCREGSIYFIGIRDVPVTLGSPGGASGSIGIELTTAGAYKFLSVPMHQLANTLFDFYDLYGREGYELQQKIMQAEQPGEKVELVQEFLFRRLLSEGRYNGIMDYSVELLSTTHGMLGVKELERKTGYSRRYLDMLFKQHLGISPKTLSTILRFQRFYKHLGSPANLASPDKNSMLDLYYDQNHFIKEFKRYTGHTPSRFMKLQNNFGKNF